jgi:methyl-accepting chemotaxis protein
VGGLGQETYVAVHNKIFSHPQGADPVWDTAHSRNRRIFDDRTVLAAARNTQPCLLQRSLSS